MDVALTVHKLDSLAGYQDALDFLFARTTGGLKFGLERTERLLEALGNPHLEYPVIHVAGTNGKGSSVATMSALLAAKGMRVATYTSPHLVDFRERIVVGGIPIPSGAVVEFISREMPLVEELEATFFEATTAMAFEYFARAGAEVAVVETGLGGRLDSTNVVLPLVAGVTSIGLDHTEYLGTTLEAIAAEKAGIFKAGRPAVIGERDPQIRELLAEHARATGATPVRIVADEIAAEHVQVDDGGSVSDLVWRGERRQLRTPLAGRHQIANLAFSLVMLDAAGPAYAVDSLGASEHLHRVRIPGRFQRSGRWIFDVAHNAAGAEVLVQTLLAVDTATPITVVLCVLRDKDWRAMLRVLARVTSHLVVTMAPTAPASRAWDPADAEAFARELGLSVERVDDLQRALERAASREGRVLVTGSFHTVGDAMSLLQVSPLAG